MTTVLEADRLPVLDDGGLLRHDGRWVAIPDAQLPVVALLVAHPGEVVSTEDIARAHAEAGGARSPVALRGLITRVRARLDLVGLTLHTIRSRGVVLDVTDSSAGTLADHTSRRNQCST